MNGFQYLMGGVYLTPCQFASVEGFGRFLAPHFEDLPFDRRSVLERLASLLAELKQPVDVVDAPAALRRLVADDLRNVEATLRSCPLRDPNESLPAYRDQCEALLRDLDLDVMPLRLFIVDQFPRPYDQMDWTATSPDAADQRSYGIEPGNYFMRKHLAPNRSDVLLTHEMMHQVIGQVDPTLLGRGLEEGIAVIFGELYAGARLVGEMAAKLHYEYTWLDATASQINRLYAEFARMAAFVYHEFGLEGILALIRGGRKKIKETEAACLSGSLRSLDLPRGGFDEEYGDRVLSATMAMPRNLVVTPLARYVADHVTVGATVRHVADAANVTCGDAKSALKELQRETFITLVDGDRVDYSDADLVTRGRALRYVVGA